MDQQTTNVKNLQLTPIKDTPFCHATNGEKNYITCGKIIMETDKNQEETKEWIKKKPWETIGMLIQAICNEMLNNKN